MEKNNLKTTKSGFVGIIGLPNVGKSTLLNQLLGTKVSIVSPKPQTTRFNIKGILTRDNFQIIFVDTPGIHEAKDLFNQMMVKEALSVLQDIDIILWVMDVTHRIPEEEKILDLIREANKPTILALNKIDLIKKQELLPIIDYFSKLYDFKAIVPISALKNDGLDRLLDELVKLLPEGPFYYEPERVTDLPLDLLIAEIIREKIFLLTYQEVPYSSAVKVEEIREEPEKNLLYIQATIFIERDSQKGIIIGKGGKMLKKIGTLAREELEFLLGKKIYLDLWVKALKDWRERETHIRRLAIPPITSRF
ncbi:GTP-binding protein Era-like-protein [Thermodesulfobacterium geofontis OPF15]|jgi:GTP-binding protein Era|uniref:GTPase Era n=1 Tax=Thermodesulfobacterium geofontis (strain OPF15) TaxID=795359 RepID=F8C472_THEGP|nr:GTPase Era [Thermodesulfobacterium geofontis]AEH22412.1 GTP-binding protein Era-like-protein [Thermodesulfobacterium geofontis OPF15]